MLKILLERWWLVATVLMTGLFWCYHLSYFPIDLVGHKDRIEVLEVSINDKVKQVHMASSVVRKSQLTLSGEKLEDIIKESSIKGIKPEQYRIEYRATEIKNSISLIYPIKDMMEFRDSNNTFSEEKEMERVYSCPDAYCEITNGDNVFTAKIKTLGFDFSAIYVAMLLSLILCFVAIIYFPLGTAGVCVALSMLLSVRLFMATSLMLNQIDYAAQVFTATVELLLLPITVAGIVTLYSSTNQQQNNLLVLFKNDLIKTLSLLFALPIILLILWWAVCVYPDIALKNNIYPNSIAYFLAFNWTNWSKYQGYWVELSLVVVLFIGYFLTFYYCFIRDFIKKPWFLSVAFLLIAILSTVASYMGGAEGKKSIPNVGLMMLLVPWGVFSLYRLIMITWNSMSFWQVLRYMLAVLVALGSSVGLFFIGFFFRDVKDIGAYAVYFPATILAMYVVFVLPIKGKQGWFIGGIKLLAILCLVVLTAMVALKSYTISYISHQVTKNGYAQINTNGLLCIKNFCQLDDWLMPIQLPDTTVMSNEQINIVVEKIQNYKDDPNGVNAKMRLYGWLIGHPFDRIVFQKPYENLAGLEQARASSIPEHLFVGDEKVAKTEDITNRPTASDGYQFEHAIGINLIRPLGLSVCLLIWGALLLLFFSTPKSNQAGQLYITILLFASVWLLLQTQGVFPVSGQSMPLLAVNSFAKDFFPILMGLIMYLAFFSDYPSVKQEK